MLHPNEGFSCIVCNVEIFRRRWMQGTLFQLPTLLVHLSLALFLLVVFTGGYPLYVDFYIELLAMGCSIVMHRFLQQIITLIGVIFLVARAFPFWWQNIPLNTLHTYASDFYLWCALSLLAAYNCYGQLALQTFLWWLDHQRQQHYTDWFIFIYTVLFSVAPFSDSYLYIDNTHTVSFCSVVDKSWKLLMTLSLGSWSLPHAKDRVRTLCFHHTNTTFR